MEADSDPISDRTHHQETEHTPDHHDTGTPPDTEEPGNAPETEEFGAAPFDKMVWQRPAPDNIPEHLPNTIPNNAEWWYDQRGKGKRGKDRRYTGHIHRIGGSAGEKIRADLAAIIRDLLEWAKQQQDEQHDVAAEKESREDGGTDDQPQ